MISYTISLGDIVVVCVAVVSITANYVLTQAYIRAVDYKVEELRHGRGLVIEAFPPLVKRCFGWTRATSGE